MWVFVLVEVNRHRPIPIESRSRRSSFRIFSGILDGFSTGDLSGRRLIVIRLPPTKQRTVRSEDDRNFSTWGNILEGGTINQPGKKSSNGAKEPLTRAT